ncbi:MAG: hypothetical protein ACLQNG_06580 [Acidimicrobiales bacterium]
MKILVVGSLPPPHAGHRRSLLAEVLRLRQEGHEVQIVSLDPLSVAHRYLAAPGVAAAFEVGLLGRRCDGVLVQIEPGLPVRRAAGRAERSVALMTLGAALRKRRDVTVRLQHLDDLPGGLGGRAAMKLWMAAGRVEVGDEATRAALADALGPLAGRVSFLPADDLLEEPSLAHTAGGGEWGEGADTTAAAVQGVVRARAAGERRSLAGRGRLPAAGTLTTPRVPQWEWLPAEGLGVPDLGPIRSARSRPRRAERRTDRPPQSLAAKLSPRRAAAWVLASAERRAVTRPVAHLARLAYAELRGAARR